MSNKIQAALEARKSRKKTDEESFKGKAKKSQEKIDSALQARESRIKNNLQSTFSDLESSINTEIEAFKKLSDPSWGGGDEALKTSLESTRQNRINVDNLIRKVEAHRKYLGDEKADTLLNNLNGMKDTYNSHVGISETRSKYKSEEEYQKEYEESVKAQENYEAMTTLNLETAKKEISDLEAKKKERDKIKSERDSIYNQIYTGYLRAGYGKEKAESTALGDARIVNYDKQLSAYGDIDSSLSGKKTTYNQAKHIQDGIKLHNDALNAEDFGNFNVSNIDFANDRTYKYINNIDDFRTTEDQYWLENGTYTSDQGLVFPVVKPKYIDANFEHMTEDEIGIYNYYYSKFGVEKANEYLNNLEQTLNTRSAVKIREENDTDFERMLFAVAAGLDQFESGMENLFNTKDDYITPSDTQIASGMIREDLGDSGFKILGSSIGQIGYDLINTTSNMLPSILTSTVAGWINPALGATVGAGLMGASASGNAYAEMLNLGYDKGQARLYSGLVGASEATLQYLLGGIGKLGGKLSSKVAVGIANNLDNAFARVAIKLGGNALGEFSEEYLQEVLDPIFKNFALGTNEDVNLFSTEALYSGILGALSAGILETGSTISADRQTTKLGKSVQGIDGGVQRLKELGTTFSADSVAYQIADKVTDETGAYKIGLLLQEAGATLSEQNVSDITIELTKKGMDETTAKRLAKTYQAFLNNEMSLSDEQVETLEGLDPLADVLRKNIIGRNTTVYQRTREYSDLVKLATEMETNTEAAPTPNTDTEASAQTTALYSKEYIDAVAKEFEANGFPAEQARVLAEMKLSTPTETNSSLIEESAVESEFEVSADGKTINKKTDKIVNVKNIESISEGGEANLTLDDGMVVKASDLAYGNDAEAIFIENIGKIKLGKKNISTNSANLIYMKAMKALENNPKMAADEATSLIKGLEESYVYGAYNFSRSELSARNEDGTAKRYAGELSQEQRAFAYELGTQERASDVERDQKVIDELKAKAKANNDTSAKTTSKKGSVRFENGVVAKGKNQKRAVSLAKHLARAIGIDIVFYDAKTATNEDGKGANGYFDPKTDTIYLDLQNSWSDAKTIAYTMSHELVHFIKKWSPAKFNTFAKFLMEQYGKHGVDASKLLSNKMAELGTTDADLAYEEMVCDACETMLLDSNAIYKLMELRKTDLELFDKIKLHIHELLNKIRNMYKKLGLKPTSDEAKALLEMKDVLEQIYSMFEEAAVDAAQSYQAVSTLETESVSVSEDGTVMMQMKQYQQTGRATLLKYLKEQYGDADANNLIATIDNIYNTMKDIKKDETLTVFSNWQDSEVELDENGHPIFTTSINNGDYELNQDFSRVCKKRRQLDFVLNMLAEDPAFEASNLTKQDFVKINKAIKEHGFEIACALCFVDSKRFRQAEWADSFANTWNDILYSVVDDKSKLTPFNFATKNPNLADDGIEIDTSKPVMYRKWSEGKEDVKNRKNYDSFENMLSKDGKKWIEGNTNVRTIATLIRDNPNLRHTFRGADIIASQGFDTIQRLAPGIRGILDGWGGSSVPKPSSNDASYDSSIINMSGYNKETAYAMGGARMNSFSDFMAHMFFDYCQAFADLAAKELPSQAYTKELIYVRLFGRSGQKINMSGIAAIRDDALPTTAQKGVSKAEAEANEKIEKMVAGLDVSRLLEHLNKDIHQLTEADVEQFLDMCDYVWADESIDMKHATLLQTGILYDKLSESKIEECYELLKAGEVEKALKVAGKANVDTEYAKHCGTIVVGVSDAHIRKLLRDPTVRMVIPYHKSGLNPIIARELRISAYNDYTLTQTTGVKRKGAKATAKIGSDEIKKAYGLKDFSFYDWFGKTIDGKVYDGKATADKYLEWCEKGYYDEKVGDYVYYTNKGDGYILAKDFHKKATIVPKFDAFMGEENYYKVLEDFDCYNTISGEHSEQGAVDFLRNGLPSDYKSVLMDALKAEQKVSDDFRDHLDNKGLKDEIMDIVKANGYEPSVKKQAKSNSRITSEMSDTERSEILRAKQIVATLYQGQADALIAKNKESLESQQLRLVKAAIATIGKEFGIIGEKINITDVDVVITLSKSNLKESVSKDVTPIQLAKLLPILKVAVENAVGIESHNNRYYFDTDTVYFENLLGGYIDGEDFVPVRFGLKHSVSGNTTLYVVVDQNKIKANLLKEKTKTEVLKATDPHEVDSSASRSVTYDIPQILKFVNSKDLLRYVPDDMLSVEQRESKWEAIAETIKKTDSKNDKKYAEYISKGNLYAAQQMVVAAAKTAGYTRKLYHGTPSKFNVFGFGRTGIFTTDNYDMAKTYGENVISLYGKEGANVLTIDAQESPHYAIRVSKDVLDFSEYPLMRGKELHSTNDISIIAFREGYDVVVIKNVYDNYSFASENAENGLGTDVIYKDPSQVKSSEVITYDDNGNIIPISQRFDSKKEDIRYQKKKNSSSYAPTFYSQMGKVVEGVKQEKLAANSVVNMLRGKGVKAEEIRWSGIVPFLEGKKSITKQELLDFINGSMLQIEEKLNEGGASITLKPSDYGNDSWDVMRGGEILDTYSWSEDSELYESDTTGGGFSTKDRILEHFKEKYGSGDTRWGQYKLDGGTNYREIVFTLPNSSYSNNMMRTHWGEDAEGVLVHARIQDFEVSGKKMLFVEEIQSDWHNEGHKEGYESNITADDREEFVKLEKIIDALNEQHDTINKEKGTLDIDYFKNEKMSFDEYSNKSVALIEELDKITAKLNRSISKREKLFSKFKNATPDAPFKENYHEYVLKRLLRMAAEQGYDSIGWTTAKTQDERWSDHQAHEEGKGMSGNLVGYTIEYDQEMPKFLRKYGRQWGAKVDKTKITTRELSTTEEMELAFIDDMMSDFERDFTRGNVEIWSMDITDSMKNSVLYEGQVMYQKKTASNRSILANALEGVAENDVEKNKLAEYKEKISLIESEEQRLSEIHQQLFTKGAVEPSQRKELQFEAKQIANRINTYDRQLLRLEATKPLQNVLNREKELARKRQKQKDAEAMREYKEKVAKTTRELLDRNRESRKKAIDSRRRTALREKIKKTVNELNTLLLRGSKERNVKLGLQESVAKALEIINMDTVGADERIAKLEDKLLKAKTPEEIQKISRTIDRIREQGDNLADKLEAMRDAYTEIRSQDNNDYAQYYKQEAELIEYVIADVIKKVGDTPIRKMTLPQLEAVYNMYRVVLQTIRYSNELHTEGKVEELRKNASSMMAELEKIKPLKEERAAVGDKFRNYSWNEMIPIYAVRRTGSQTLEKFFWEMIRGQNTFAKDVKEANDFSTATREKYGHSKWDLNKVHEFKLADGRTFRLTLEHMMSIYAYSKREQAFEHMTTGGFFFNDKATFRKKGGVLDIIKSNEEGYTVDLEVLQTITAKMEEEAKGSIKYVDEMQEYLTKMGEKGNEVSRVVWGIDIFKEKVYFPLKSSKDFIFQANQTAQETSLKHDGMTKETKPGASNPIILEAFDDVWANHVNRMSQYHGFVVPIDNMNKLLNYGSWAGTASVSVTTMLRARYGDAVNEYFNNFIKDMNGASSTSGASNPFFSFVGKFKKTAVAASASVVVQQPTAILRAMAVMDGKYFIGLPEAHKLSTKWNELQEYAPITTIKEIGGFDAGAGRQASEWLNSDARRGIDKIEGKIDDITMKGAAIGDQIGWCTIWEAVKREIKATTNLKVGSEEFLKKAGERFTEVIVLTQVYDSTLSRSGYMRSKHDSVKMLTAFMGEPTVSFNMMYDATLQATRKTITKRKAVRIVSATYTSIIAASVFASLIYALRDDDEDESYLEKFAEAFGGKLLGDINPLNMLPGVRDIFSIFDGWDVERTDMAVFKDIKDAFDGLFSENKSIQRKIEDFAGAVASFFGVPLKNILRTGREIYNGINDILVDDITPSGVGGAFVRGIKGEKKDKNNALYNAIANGDKERLEVLRKGYKDDKAYETAVRKALRENDSRIKEAAEARIDGNIAEYARIVKAIKAEGFFSQDTIVASVNAEINAINKGESSSSNSSTEDKASSIYKIDDYYASIIGGDQASAYVVKEDIINIDVANGKDRDEAESSFNSKFASYLREEYEKGNLSGQEAERMLVNYGDKSEEEAASKVQYWEFKQKYPDYDDLSEEAVTKYYDKVEPYGINIGVYYDYSKQRSKCKGTDANGDGKTDSGSVKTEVLRVINSLPISSSQKDALYYLNGWSAKTIYEAPWH